MVTVRPSAARRQAFARWAITVGVRTVSSHDFEVPAVLFAAIPARLLDGCLVDGQPLEQTPPDPGPDPAPGPAPVPAPVAVAVALAATGSQEGPGAPQADGGGDPAPDTTTGPDGPPAAAEAPQPAEEPPAQPDAELATELATEPATGQLDCPHCPRSFASPHGLRTHVGMTHPDQAPPGPPE